MKLLLTKNETCSMVSLSPSKIDRMVTDNRFPQSVKIGSNVRWRYNDIKDWVDKLASNDTPDSSKKRGRPRLAT